VASAVTSSEGCGTDVQAMPNFTRVYTVRLQYVVYKYCQKAQLALPIPFHERINFGALYVS